MFWLVHILPVVVLLCIATISRSSDHLAVRPSVCNVDVYRGHISWVHSKIITRISLGSSHLWTTTSAIYSREHPRNSGGIGWGRYSQQKKTCSISETGQDRTKVTVDDDQCPFFRGKFCQIPRHNLWNSVKFRGTVIPKFPTFCSQ